MAQSQIALKAGAARPTMFARLTRAATRRHELARQFRIVRRMLAEREAGLETGARI